jgi:hypothetical protein
MNRYLYFGGNPEPVAVATTEHAANRPRSGASNQYMVVWTDDDLEKLHIPGLISIVDRIDNEGPNQSNATGGVNLDKDDIAVISEIGIEILEGYVSEVQMELNAMEDSACRHDLSLALCAANEVPMRN